MNRNWAVLGLLLIALLIFGCMAAQGNVNNPQSSEGNQNPAPVKTYQCPDGSIVTNLSSCQPHCPASCSDNNPCTRDYCDSSTNFGCKHDSLNGPQTGCSGNCSDGVCMCSIQESHLTGWNVTWKTYANGQLGSIIGYANFPATFDYKWDSGDEIYNHYKQYIGFSASATINVPTSENVSFNIASDDGSRLYVDGTLIIDNWHDQYVTPATSEVHLIAGKHTLTLEYYQKDLSAEVAFSTLNSEVLSWTETIGKPC